MKEAGGLLAILREQIRAVRADQSAGTLERARAIGALTDSALRVLQVGILQERMEALERVLNGRKGDNEE
jgi:hypothetical protein